MSFDLLKQALSKPIFKDIKFNNDDSISVPIRQLQLNSVKCPPGSFCRVPPHPDVKEALIADFRKEGKGLKPFYQFARNKGKLPVCPTTLIQAEERAEYRKVSLNTGLAKVNVPTTKLSGDVYLNVLLIMFPDQKPEAKYTKRHYEQLLFSEGVLPNGSVKEFYREVTQGKINIKGFVSDWLMMPQPKSYYSDKQNGTGPNFPKNTQGLTADAIKVAQANNVVFPPELDFKKNGSVGAFYVVAAGKGAEVTQNPNDIWSHKWNTRSPIPVGEDLFVSTYLYVPEDAQIGVCSHELGHLAFEWDDFYDPNYDQDGIGWDGAGVWDLMAGGSWNGTQEPGDLPAPPASLHRLQHGWLDSNIITKTTKGLVLKPQDSKQAQAVVIRSKNFTATQSLILENRSTSIGTKYDKGLPGGGLLLWKVDTSQFQTSPKNPGMSLVQADQLQELETSRDRDDGDAGDPFPGTKNTTQVTDSGKIISTSFSTKKKSGITLDKIRLDPTTQNITLDVNFA